ncbi:MAG: AzlC family ABC transporter permease [Kiritimatiellae bacterium]|nr:AzlC family ABC transporter permease [Kiritimatiellia bacterium]
MSQESSSIAPFERRAIFRRALLNSLPVMMGYTTMGLAAGVLLAAKGGVEFAPLWSLAIATVCISGTLSFALVPAIAAQEPLAAVAFLTLGINFRYAFYGFSLLGRWKDVPFFRKWFLVHSLSDEIYALDIACRIKDPLKYGTYCLWNHALCWLYWIVGSVAGAMAGAALPVPSNGIEFAMVALFLVILTDQLKGFSKNA